MATNTPTKNPAAIVAPAGVAAVAAAPTEERQERTGTGADLNMCILIGNAKAEPTIGEIQAGGVKYKTAEIILAVSTRNGRTVATQWQTCRAIGQTAEMLERYVKTGTQLSIVGTSQTSLYASPSKVKRASLVQFIADVENAGQNTVSLEALKSLLATDEVKATDRGQYFNISQFGLLGKKEAEASPDADAMAQLGAMESSIDA
jgi:single-stranded DNA-binding protein